MFLVGIAIATTSKKNNTTSIVAVTRRCSEKFRKIHRKTPVSESFFNKVQGLTPSNFIKKRPQHRYFPVNFVKFLRTPFFAEQPRWLFYKVTNLVPIKPV